MPRRGGCLGQQALEEEFLRVWAQAEADGIVDPGPAGLRRGQACLHLDLRPDPLFFSFLLAVMVPVLETPTGGVPVFSGVAGLRLVSTDAHRFVLRRWDGHGCLVLHTDDHGVDQWQEWTAVKTQESAAAGSGFEPLWHRDGLCEQEAQALSLAAGANETVMAEEGAGRHPAHRVPEDLRLAHEPRRAASDAPHRLARWSPLPGAGPCGARGGRTGPTHGADEPSSAGGRPGPAAGRAVGGRADPAG